MFPYAVESFSAEEADILRRYVTNLDQPVFALVNLPEVVKGALFARYSRSHKSLRRLFLDEFVGELDISGDASVDATVGLKRAEEVYEKVFFEYGDDSVAQLGGVHLACEQASNVLTKVLEWGRLMAYLEQSTRYIVYDSRLGSGHYRYYRDPDVLDSPLGARYVGDMDRMFDSYAKLLPELQTWLARRYPRQPNDSDFVHRQSIRATALVTLDDWDPEGEDKVIAAICYPHMAISESDALRRVRALGSDDKRAIIRAYVGERTNRRHRPGRAFERTDYRFDVVSDYGAFRDLQRHRMLTIEWQPLGTTLGYDVPEVVDGAGLTDRYVTSLERSRELAEVLDGPFPVESVYAVALAYRIRYSMQMNAREAMHLLELRSGPQGHPSYRWVAQEMHRQIAERAGHRLLAEAMSHVDYGAENLERLKAERRAEQRRNSIPAATNPAMP